MANLPKQVRPRGQAKGRLERMPSAVVRHIMKHHAVPVAPKVPTIKQPIPKSCQDCGHALHIAAIKFGLRRARALLSVPIVAGAILKRKPSRCPCAEICISRPAVDLDIAPQRRSCAYPGPDIGPGSSLPVALPAAGAGINSQSLPINHK
jgi:hypothetical protein